MSSEMNADQLCKYQSHDAACMHLHRWGKVTLLVSLLIGCVVGGNTRGTLVHLASGDSIVVLSLGVTVDAAGRRGLVLEFRPFIALSDTAKLGRETREIWAWVRPTADSADVSFALLRATTRSAGPAIGFQRVQNYAYVVEKQKDGEWLFWDAPPSPSDRTRD